MSTRRWRVGCSGNDSAQTLLQSRAVSETTMRLSQIVTALAWVVACTSAAPASPSAPPPGSAEFREVRVYPSASEDAITEGET
ncbi:MAG TPA: hypothetical protein VK607_02440, partial [Kofleriaceae bacterium]|nr:hypothetical protein [Kofleriaceae bacterium]